MSEAAAPSNTQGAAPSAVQGVTQALIDQVQQARVSGKPLRIRGGDTKAFYGEQPLAGLVPFAELDVRPLCGISSYEPSELVVTVRAGTPLAELEAALAEQGQCLPFEPPHYAPGATVGGMLAAGLAGPARAAVGAVRDYVLGATVLNGKAEVMSFGGQVMKNVAGYDLARAMAGSMGTLGVILEASLKVLPLAPAQCTLRFDMPQDQALQRINEWIGQALPVNASAWWEGALVLRLSGAVAAVQSAAQRLGGEVIDAGMAHSFWQGLRNQNDEFFEAASKATKAQAQALLWRLSVPATAPVLPLPGQQLVEWAGAQRWLCSNVPAQAVREAAAAVGGHATLFRGADRSAGVFTPLADPLARIQRALKASFDPQGLFNPGRLYPHW